MKTPVILAVDEEPIFLTLLDEFLKRFGFQPLLAPVFMRSWT